MITTPVITRKRFRTPSRKNIDWTHPMTSGLVSCHIPVGLGTVKDLCGRLNLLPYRIGTDGTMPSNDSTTWGSLGMTSSGITPQGSVAKTGLSGPLSLQPPVTLMWVGRFNGEPSAGPIFYGLDFNGFGGTEYTCCLFKAGFAGWLKFNVYSGGTNYGAESFGISPDYTVPIPRVLFGTASASGMALWMNGVRLATNATAITTLDYTNGFEASNGSFMCMNVRNGTNNGNSNITSNMGAIWNRALSDAEIIRLSADPFLFLK